MAQNRRSDRDPPHNSDSEEEEEEETSSEENGEPEGSESEEEEEEEDGNTLLSTPPVSKKISASKKSEASETSAKPQPSSSDESGSDSESDSPPDKPSKVDPNIKPLASKPMDDQPKSAKKPRSKSNALPSSPTRVKPTAAAKRPAESEANDSKRAKRKVDYDGGDSEKKATGTPAPDDSKKQLFQRLWSEEDEIAILKGMMDYTAKKKADPVADMNAFHEYIKNSLHVDVSKAQLSAKVRRLKKKYENNSSKEKKGKERSFSKAHEQKAYELSKKVWGREKNAAPIENDSAKTNGTPRKTQVPRASKANAASSKGDQVLSPNETKEVAEAEIKKNALSSWFVQIGNSATEEKIVRDGLELTTGLKRKELEEKWNKLRVREIELYLEKLDLITEQTKLLLDTLKSGH